MRRRRLLLLAAGWLAVPLRSLAQGAGKVWRVGFLSPRRRPASLDADYYGAFPRRLRELGYVEGKNLVIEWRFADGDYGRLPGLAAELVRSRVDVILALGPPGAIAARNATSTVPVVFVVSTDPVAAGLVRTLARPGGNVTGLSNLGGDLSAKHLELLRVMAPKLARVAMLLNPGNPAHAATFSNVETASSASRITMLRVNAQTAGEIDGAFATIDRERAGALIVPLDPLFIQEARHIASLAIRQRLPTMFAFREAVEAGGLMSYGQNQVDIYVRAAGYVDSILRGAHPGDLPVEQPTKLELFINRTTATALGLAIPQALQVRADKVVE